MTATEELRRMLDERGVEWSAIHDTCTSWQMPVGNQMWDGFRIPVWYDGTLHVECVMSPTQAIAATVGAGTCEADETELIPFVHADGDISKVDYIHVMECTECGHTYEHVNGDYEYCPRCGRKRKDFVE